MAASLRRLQAELEGLMQRVGAQDSPIVSCELPNDEMTNWMVELRFPKDSAFQHDLEDYARQKMKKSSATLKLHIKFPPEYPFAPPEMWIKRPRLRYLTTQVSFGGKICSEVLTANGWTPSLRIFDILEIVKQQLIESGAKVDMPTAAVGGYQPAPKELNRLATSMFPTVNKFDKRLKVVSAARASGFFGDMSRIENSGKIALPFEFAKAVYENPDIKTPLMFELKTRAGRKMHCSIEDFMDGLPEEMVVVPSWMVENLFVQEDEQVQIRSVELPLIQLVKVQPHSMDFYLAVRDSGKEVVTILQDSLRHCSALTEDTSVPIKVGDAGTFLVEVVRLEPQAAVRLIDLNVTQDFEFKVDFEPAPDLEDEEAKDKRLKKLLERKAARDEKQAAMKKVTDAASRKKQEMAYKGKMAMFSRLLEPHKAPDDASGPDIVEIALRLPAGSDRLSVKLKVDAPVVALLGVVYLSDWAKEVLPYDVSLSTAFPKKTLSEDERVTKDLHRAVLTVTEIPAPGGLFFVEAPQDDTDNEEEPAKPLDWDNLFEQTRIAHEEQATLQQQMKAGSAAVPAGGGDGSAQAPEAVSTPGVTDAARHEQLVQQVRDFTEASDNAARTALQNNDWDVQRAANEILGA